MILLLTYMLAQAFASPPAPPAPSARTMSGQTPSTAGSADDAIGKAPGCNAAGTSETPEVEPCSSKSTLQEVFPDGTVRIPRDPEMPRFLNMHEVFSSDDYPVDALRREQQGIVRARVKVDPAGRALTCSIVETSGAVSLDATTCRLLIERGRFTPAKQEASPTLERNSVVLINWALPADTGMPVEFRAPTLVFSFDKDGKISGCRPDSGAVPERSRIDCSGMILDAAESVEHRVDASRRAHRKLVYEMGSYIGESSSSGIGEGAGVELIARILLQLTVEADGGVSACEGIGSNGTSETVIATWCEAAKKTRYEALAPDVVNRQPRRITSYAAYYFRR